ncbi:MAG: pyrroline-5-carboxylate reductase [Acidimicrobiia bacterium]
MGSTIAILGAGAIGEALAGGLLKAGWSPDELVLAARREERRAEVERLTGVTTVMDAAEAMSGREVVVISVKPADVPALLEQIDGTVAPEQVIVSLAAGVPTWVFEQALGEVAVVRAMPNTPAEIHQAVTAMCAGRYAGEQAVTKAQAVLGAVGTTVILDEGLLDAVTAVSGTGPAYLFLLAEALTEAAVREGLPLYAAELLVELTMKGAGMLLADTDASPFKLRSNVTSPGGTTAAAIHVLEERGFRALIEDAVRAAAQRSRDLGAATIGEGERG